MGTSEETLRNWENGKTPVAASYPGIIKFLGRDPWPAPTTLPQAIRAARRRRGLRIEEAAKLLGVDPTTMWWWERGRQVHRVDDRNRVAQFVSEPSDQSTPSVVDGPAEEPSIKITDLGAMLRDRRATLDLTQEAAAEVIGVSVWTLLRWESGEHTPTDRYYPSLILFLECEPWPEPDTLGERLRAQRLRQGLSCTQFAAVLQVDAGSVAAWESGRGPHHGITKAKVEAFLTGVVRPSRAGRHKKNRKARPAKAKPTFPESDP